MPFVMKTKKKVESVSVEKDVSEKKLKNIAAVLDSAGTVGLKKEKI
jgi:hypothetical protein